MGVGVAQLKEDDVHVVCASYKMLFCIEIGNLYF